MNFENVEAQISLRDKVNREKYIGSDENWEKAEQAIIEACEEKGLSAKWNMVRLHSMGLSWILW